MKEQETYAAYMARGYETCADCSHCRRGYCDVYDKKVNPNSPACPEFEEN